MNYQLMAAGFLPVSIAKENRLECFEVLEDYAVNGNLQPFAEMIAELEEERLDEYLGIVQESCFKIYLLGLRYGLFDESVHFL